MFSSVDTLWTRWNGIAFFMQAGFAMVETGFTRAKNAANIIKVEKILWTLYSDHWDSSLSATASCLGTISPASSELLLYLWKDLIPPFLELSISCSKTYSRQLQPLSYPELLRNGQNSALISCTLSSFLLIYPISGHWIWGGGWLAQMGFIDFAGSTAVHMVGGVAALVEASSVHVSENIKMVKHKSFPATI